MNLQYTYYWIKECIDVESCEKILELGKDRLQENLLSGEGIAANTMGGNARNVTGPSGNPAPKKARPAEATMDDMKRDIGGAGEDLDTGHYVRDSEICWLNDQWLYDMVWPHVLTANDKAGWRWEFDYGEPFQFTKYTEGGFYGWHSDGNSDHFGKFKRVIPGVTPMTEGGYYPTYYVNDPSMIGKVRKVSITINLNKPGEYEGGNLKFDLGPHATNDRYMECKEIRPQGSMVVFPSFVHHQVTPIISGTRYSLVLWILGKPWK